MSARHAPHTPLWREVLSLPRTSLGWWAIGLASPFLFLNVLEILGWTFPFPESVGMAIWLTVILVGLPGAILGLIAVAHRDRSWLVWVAQVPALLVFALFVGAAISIWGGGRGWYAEPDMRVILPIAVLLWAFLNVGIISFSIFYKRYVDPQGETEDSR
jgi:hypothetical protein